MNESPMYIRDARPGDAASLAGLHIASREQAMPWLPRLHTLEETVDWMRTRVIGAHRVRVAKWNDRIVGYTAFHDGWVEQLYVTPDAQGIGVGSRLFEDVRSTATNSFRFWVFQRNVAARRFYERQGCVLIRLTDGSANEEREPDAMYESPGR